MELKARLQRLVEVDISQDRIRKNLNMKKKKKEKRTKKKLHNPNRGIFAVKELLISR